MSEDGAYDVGYGKPPAETRFRKGQSGNPRGRPKKTKPQTLRLADAPMLNGMDDEFYRPVRIRENGEVTELPAARALMRSIMQKAMTGNRLERKWAFEMISKYEDEAQSAQIEKYFELAEAKRNGEAVLADCKARGIKPPKLLPHPDDIVLNPHEYIAWVEGPRFPGDELRYQASVHFRDLFRAYSDWDRRHDRVIYWENTKLCVCLVTAAILDMRLPHSLRMSESERINAMMRLRSMRNAQLSRHIADLKQKASDAARHLPPLSPQMTRKIARMVKDAKASRDAVEAQRADDHR